MNLILLKLAPFALLFSVLNQTQSTASTQTPSSILLATLEDSAQNSPDQKPLAMVIRPLQQDQNTIRRTLDAFSIGNDFKIAEAVTLIEAGASGYVPEIGILGAGALTRSQTISLSPVQSQEARRRLGIGQATLVATSKWATIRYLGESPAGQGLSGNALWQAQKEGLGNPNDVLPITTSAQTITEMMEEFYAPLLKLMPGGHEILQSIHVQGAYFSPTYNPPDGIRLDYDNAFIVGLQSLYIYPSSCYHRPNPDSCKPPFLSTGHDPTVIGHEMGHVIFNHIRESRSLKGFQWFAVNEGYADFFSASYFESPLIGETWQKSRTNAPYLRRLLDNPSTRDPAALESAHAFSVVWSSLLWRLRTRLTTEQNVSKHDFDRAVMLSIFHLGEGGGSSLGEAATALFKAVYELGFVKWDALMREEVQRSKIELTAENLSQMSLVPYQNASDREYPAGRGTGSSCTVGAGQKLERRSWHLDLGDMLIACLSAILLVFHFKRSKAYKTEQRLRGLV